MLSFFLSQNPIWDPTHSGIWLLLKGMISQAFLVFDVPCSLSQSGICRKALSLGSSGIFVMIRVGFWIWRKATEVKCPSDPVLPRVCVSVSWIVAHSDLDHWADVRTCCAAPPQSYFSLPLCCSFWKELTLWGSCLRMRSYILPPWKQKGYINYFNSCTQDIFLLIPHVCIHFFICVKMNWSYVPHTLIITQHCFILSFQLWPLETLPVGFYVPLTGSIIVSLLMFDWVIGLVTKF